LVDTSHISFTLYASNLIGLAKKLINFFIFEVSRLIYSSLRVASHFLCGALKPGHRGIH